MGRVADRAIDTPVNGSRRWGLVEVGQPIRLPGIGGPPVVVTPGDYDVHPKVASERAGHSRVGVTLDRYSHVIPSLQEDAALRIDATLRKVLAR